MTEQFFVDFSMSYDEYHTLIVNLHDSYLLVQPLKMLKILLMKKIIQKKLIEVNSGMQNF